jgi:hypothetical protein
LLTDDSSDEESHSVKLTNKMLSKSEEKDTKRSEEQRYKGGKNEQERDEITPVLKKQKTSKSESPKKAKTIQETKEKIVYFLIINYSH